MKKRAIKYSRRGDQLRNLIIGHSSHAQPARRISRSPLTPTVSFREEWPAAPCCDSATNKWCQQHQSTGVMPQFDVRKSNAANGAAALAWRNPLSQRSKYVSVWHHRSRQSVRKAMCYGLRDQLRSVSKEQQAVPVCRHRVCLPN